MAVQISTRTAHRDGMERSERERARQAVKGGSVGAAGSAGKGGFEHGASAENVEGGLAGSLSQGASLVFEAATRLPSAQFALNQERFSPNRAYFPFTQASFAPVTPERERRRAAGLLSHFRWGIGGFVLGMIAWSFVGIWDFLENALPPHRPQTSQGQGPVRANVEIVPTAEFARPAMEGGGAKAALLVTGCSELVRNLTTRRTIVRACRANLRHTADLAERAGPAGGAR